MAHLLSNDQEIATNAICPSFLHFCGILSHSRIESITMSNSSAHLIAACAPNGTIHPAPGEVRDSMSSLQSVAHPTSISTVEENGQTTDHEEVSPANEAAAGDESGKEQEDNSISVHEIAEIVVQEQQRMEEVLRYSVRDDFEGTASIAAQSEAEDNKEVVSEDVGEEKIMAPGPPEQTTNVSLDPAIGDSKTLAAVAGKLPETQFDVRVIDAESRTSSEPRTPNSVGADSRSVNSDSPSSRPGTAMTELDLEDNSYSSRFGGIQDKMAVEKFKSTARLTGTPLFKSNLTLSREATFEVSTLRAKALNEYWGRTIPEVYTAK